MNNNKYISGTIGYIYLKNLKNKNNILLLSDNHSSQNYCKDNRKFVSDWMETKNSNIAILTISNFFIFKMKFIIRFIFYKS